MTKIRNRWPLFAVAALLVAGVALAHGGYIDPTHLTAAPLMVPFMLMGDTVPVAGAKALRELTAKRASLLDASSSVAKAAEAAGVELTAEQKKTIDDNLAAIALLDADINRLKALNDAARNAVVVEGNIVHTRENLLEDKKFGFKSFGEFAATVRAATINPAGTDKRLAIIAAAPTTFGNELTGADGGYLVPPQFSDSIFRLSLGEDSFLPYTDQVEIDGNGMVFPRDETTPWGTNGVRAYWLAEAAAGTQTKPVLGANQMRLHKLIALVPITDELLADSRALEGYLPSKVADSIRWKSNEAIINGSGAGQPQGVVNSGAVITVSKDSGQAASTLTITNLANMIAQLPPGSFGRAVWLINNSVLGALFSLNSGGFPYYLPFGNGKGPLADSPYGSLLGRPVIVSQHANTFSSLGDVQLHDFSYYQTITKAGGVETASSMHLYFDADATAFRTVFRIDGRSKLTAAISPAKGSTKLSPFLQLQNR